MTAIYYCYEEASANEGNDRNYQKQDYYEQKPHKMRAMAEHIRHIIIMLRTTKIKAVTETTQI